MDEKTAVVVYVTQYALTKGILKINAEIRGNSAYEIGTRYPLWIYGAGKNWHYTEEEALKEAEIKRIAKIKSLEKQLDKIKKKVFKVREK